MITQKIEIEEEFSDPNINYNVLMSKLRTRINTLENDFNNVDDSIVKGFIQKELFKLRKEYFGYLKIDIELQHMMLIHPEVYGGGNIDENI